MRFNYCRILHVNLSCCFLFVVGFYIIFIWAKKKQVLTFISGFNKVFQGTFFTEHLRLLLQRLIAHNLYTQNLSVRSLKRFFSHLFFFSCCKGHFHESFKTSLLLNCYFLSSTEVSIFQCVRWRFVAWYFIKADPRKFSINFVD